MPNLPNLKEDADRTSTPDPITPKSIWDVAREQIDARYAVDLGSPNDWKRWEYHEEAMKREEEAKRAWQNELARIDLQMFPYALDNANKAAFGVNTDTLNRRVHQIKQQEMEQTKVEAERERVLYYLKLMSGAE